jgi:hypothetical protein
MIRDLAGEERSFGRRALVLLDIMAASCAADMPNTLCAWQELGFFCWKSAQSIWRQSTKPDWAGSAFMRTYIRSCLKKTTLWTKWTARVSLIDMAAMRELGTRRMKPRVPLCRCRAAAKPRRGYSVLRKEIRSFLSCAERSRPKG